ncbi:hypothetical protein [Corynebacterium striatum]|uniref:hypothetical protein n=1 Tax=Corynebacterium striatum TaxID=43770 RepID=UPI0006998A73|nr:hypothetical protein [Corynebacterium striatum]MBD0853756.1 hypothetical protein [Corynebacterium striatum]MDK7885096.1 hypothetical protein [Corynebacterium striatum]MDK8843102.1 hypothetical protein [Corynebacterium striatum]
MKTDARRVYVFIAIGLLSAVFVGLGVWKISAPGPSMAKNQSESMTPVGHTESTQAETTQTTTSSHTSKRAPKKSSVALQNDPYLAPNAITGTGANFGPTAVYRPENLSSQSRATAQQYGGNSHYGTGQEPSNNAQLGTSSSSESAATASESPTQSAVPSPAPPHTATPTETSPNRTVPNENKRKRGSNSEPPAVKPIEPSEPADDPTKQNGTAAPESEPAPTTDANGRTVDAPQPSVEPVNPNAPKEPTDYSPAEGSE